MSADCVHDEDAVVVQLDAHNLSLAVYLAHRFDAASVGKQSVTYELVQVHPDLFANLDLQPYGHAEHPHNPCVFYEATQQKLGFVVVESEDF